MPSLFTRLYAQRPSPERNQRENFLTEAFAYVLEKDAVFRDRWIKSLQWRHAPKQKAIQRHCRNRILRIKGISSTVSSEPIRLKLRTSELTLRNNNLYLPGEISANSIVLPDKTCNL